MTNHADLIAALRIPMNVTLRKGAPELDEYDEQRKAAADRIEELEAKLAKAVDVLRVAVSYAGPGDDWVSQARAVLAEINGGGDT